MTSILFSAIVQHAKMLLLAVNASIGRAGPEIVYVNEAFTKVTGYEANEVISQTPEFFKKK